MIQMWQIFMLSIVMLFTIIIFYIFQSPGIKNMGYYKIKLLTYLWLVLDNIKARIKPLTVNDIGIEWKCTFDVNLNNLPHCGLEEV